MKIKSNCPYCKNVFQIPHPKKVILESVKLDCHDFWLVWLQEGNPLPVKNEDFAMFFEIKKGIVQPIASLSCV